MSEATTKKAAPKRKAASRKKAAAVAESLQPLKGEGVQPLNTPESTDAYLISTPSQVVSATENLQPLKGEDTASENANDYLIIEQFATADLSIHPDLLGLAAPSASEDAELEEAISTQGILQPLIVNSQKQILDGARRHGKAVKLKLPTVPVIVDDRVDAVAVALTTALTRRHLSKGQRALYIFKLHNGPDKSSPRELERRYGLCDTLFAQLGTMQKNSSSEEWTAIVAKIEAEDGSLAEQYKGYLGRKSTKDQPRAQEQAANHVTRLLNGVGSIGQQGKHWDLFETEYQGQVIDKVREAFSKLPPSFLGVLNKLCAEIVSAKTAQG